MADTEQDIATAVRSDSTEYMLSTVDNPFDPFTQFQQWYAFDTGMGYHSSSLLARVAKTSDELSEANQRFATQVAIEEIVRENVSGMHRKVSRSSSL